VLIIRELQSFALQRQQAIFYEDMHGMVARVHAEMDVSFCCPPPLPELSSASASFLKACLVIPGPATHRRGVIGVGGPKTGNRLFADRLQHGRGVNVLCVVDAGGSRRRGYAHAGGAKLRLENREVRDSL
jgi:hypothetical protein